MNTIVPLEWIAVFEDETTFSSVQGSWSEFSDLVEINGSSFHLSRSPIREVVITFEDKKYTLLPDEPFPCFAFHRWAAPSGNNPVWLYSAFGFMRNGLRVLIRVGKLGVQTRVEDSRKPFIL